MTPLMWRKSSYSDSNAGQCIEVAARHDEIALRDSKDPEGPVLTLPRGDWQGFVRAYSE